MESITLENTTGQGYLKESVSSTELSGVMIPPDERHIEKNRQLLKTKGHAYGAGLLLAKKWKFNKFLSIEELTEEIEFVLSIFELIGARPWVGLFSSILKARFYRRLKDKGYVILNDYSARLVHGMAGIRKRFVSYGE
jgi:hypothetical protein